MRSEVRSLTDVIATLRAAQGESRSVAFAPSVTPGAAARGASLSSSIALDVEAENATLEMSSTSASAAAFAVTSGERMDK